MHDVEHVVGQLAAGAVRPAARSACAMSATPRPRLFVGVGPRERNVAPASSRRAAGMRIGPPKRVRVGQAEAALRAVDLEPRVVVQAQTSKLVTSVAMAPLAKSSTAATWVGTSTVIRSPARGWLVMVRSGKRDPRRAGHPPHRAQQGDERGQVVRPHVEQRPAAGLVVEVGVGMPALVAVAEHEGRRRPPARRWPRRRSAGGRSAGRRRGRCPARRRRAGRRRGPSRPAALPSARAMASGFSL